MFALAPVTSDTDAPKTRAIGGRLRGALKGLSSFADWVDGGESRERRASPSETVTDAIISYMRGEVSER
ncbi:MAG: hypothetical protein ABI577_15990 [bacterium]